MKRNKIFYRVKQKFAIFCAKQELKRLLAAMGTSKPTFTELHYFIGTCASLYDLYGYVPQGYICDAARIIERNRQLEAGRLIAHYALKEVH